MDSLPIEIRAMILEHVHSVMRLFARLVCKEWKDLIPYRKPPYQVYWYLLDNDYIDLIKYLIVFYRGDALKYALRRGNIEVLNLLGTDDWRVYYSEVGNVETREWAEERGIVSETLDYL